MMESSRGALVILLLFGLIIKESTGDTRYYVKVRRHSTDPFESDGGLRRIGQEDPNGSGISVSRAASHARKSGSNFHVDDETMIRESLKANEERRNSFVESSTFDPDVLNKFLDDYANKIKSTTDRGDDNPFRVKIPQGLDDDDRTTNGDATSSTEYDPGTSNGTENVLNSTLESTGMSAQELNDTDKRNKYYGTNTNDEKNGWVTLEAIPWSKSKISKWQANTNPQRPWPEVKIWNKPNTEKPWDMNRPSRPAYVNNEPWNHGPIYQSGRPQTRPLAPSRPSTSTRPSYFADRFDSNPNQAQKWPPERPASSWEKFPSSDTYRPNSDIITDDRPSNFPNSWNKYSQISNNNKPTYSNYENGDRFTSNGNINNYNANKYIQQDESHDWHDNNNNYPPKDSPPSFGRPGGDDDLDQDHLNRPHQQSHYPFGMDHPQSHPSTGEGQWVLLSTNRGYSKSRQRSLKVDTFNGTSQIPVKNDMSIPRPSMVKDEDDGTIAVMTSKRQVRLTVLPSLNGTNTTTSHGGLLEVERTFKTVDQSQKEYEDSKNDVKVPTSLKRRPIRNTIAGRPSNSAVLAAVGAGMLPATMAMMIPMILGRKKRSNNFIEPHVALPYEFDEDSTNFYRKSQRRRRELAFEERA